MAVQSRRPAERAYLHVATARYALRYAMYVFDAWGREAEAVRMMPRLAGREHVRPERVLKKLDVSAFLPAPGLNYSN